MHRPILALAIGIVILLGVSFILIPEQHAASQPGLISSPGLSFLSTRYSRSAAVEALSLGSNAVISAGGVRDTAVRLGRLVANAIPQIDFVVTKTADTNDGACDADCSLREAIAAANSNHDTNTITFNIPGTDAGCTGGVCTITLGGSELDITNSVNIDGAGSKVIVSGNDQSRVFYIASGSTVSFSQITVTRGYVVTAWTIAGSGILNNGTLTTTNSTVSNNIVHGDGTSGAGIGNHGTLTVIASTISGNWASAWWAGGGGGIANDGTATIVNSTISGNTADGRSNTGGAGILNGGTLTVTSSTISGNTLGSWGNAGGIYNSATATLSNTIVANQTNGADCYGSITSSGYDLESSTTCGFTGTGDRQNTDPNIGALADNGGPTLTHALFVGSAAINTIPNGTNGCGTTITNDQRGISRPQESGCDMGAFEATPCATSPAGIVSWWPGENNANDIVGPNNAVLFGNANYVAGKVRQAFNFDGDGDFAQVATPVSIPVGSAPRTVELWLRTPVNLTSSTESGIFQYGTANPNQMFGLITSAGAPGKLYFYGHFADLAGTTTLQPNTWYHAAVTYDGTTVRLYLNGVEENSGTIALNTTMNPAAGITIGLRPGSTFWTGQIDEPAIYNRALSQAEIQSIYNAGYAGKCIPSPTPTPTPTPTPFTKLVISQVYGDGGFSGAPYDHDFIELFNAGNQSVSLTGWSVQYAAATGTSWSVTNLTGTLLPGHYYLVQEATNGPLGSPLPAPDATGSMNMSATQGKVALVNSNTALTGNGCPFASSVVDFVGYGAADCFEGPNHAPALGGTANPNADFRAANGCIDTDNNTADFATGAPSPRNSNSPPNDCSAPTPTPTPTATPTPTPVPTCVPPPSGMVRWWPGENNANDISGHGNNGTVNNGAAFAAGEVGQAFSFDGSGSNVKFPAAMNFGTGNGLTIDLWISPANLNPGPLAEWNTGSGSGLAGTIGTHFYISGGGPQGNLYANFIDTAGNSHVLSSAAGIVSTNVLQHVAVTYDNTTGLATIYLNGTVVAEPTNLGVFTPQTGYDLYLGYRPAGDAAPLGYAGLMDEVEVFNRALTQTEIQSIYNAGSAGKCQLTCTAPPSGMVGWWPGENNANDISGNGNDGTPNNGATFATGIVGQAFSLDGADAVVQVNDNAAWNFGTNDFTIDTWVNFNAIGPNNAFLAHDAGGGWQNKWIFWLRSGNLDFHINTTEGNVTYISVPWSPTTGLWYHVAITRTGGGTYKFYVNGSQIGEDQTNSIVIPNATAPLTIGKAEQIASLNGLVDEVEIFSRALSQTEIQSIYNAGYAGKCHTSTLQFGSTTYNVAENVSGGNATVTVTRTAANDTAVAVDYATVPGGTATAGTNCGGSADYQTITGMLNFASGETLKTFTIPICDDTIYEGNETVNLQLSNATGTGASLGSPSSSVLTVQSEDRQDQTITFGPLANKTFGDPDFTVSAAATSGLPVSFGASGNCTVTSPSPGTVHLTGPGSCTITASQGGDPTYNPALNVLQSFNIDKTNQTITFGALANKTIGDSDFMVSATASSGLPVSFDASGNCTVTSPSPGTVHITGAGSCTITATQAGDSNYNPAIPVPQSFSIAKQNQTITFGFIPNVSFGDPDFGVGATASSGLPVSFSANGACTIAGNTVHIVSGGSCSITASQAGNSNYNAAPDVSRTFAIVKMGQTIDFGPLANKMIGDPDFDLSATASSALPVSFSGSGNCIVTGTIVHLNAVGSCTITATQDGNENYHEAPVVSRTFAITKRDQTITFGALANKTFGDPDFNVSATASSGLTVSLAATGNCTISGNTVHLTGAGSCTITASQAGDATYNAAPDVPQTFTITKANQTITFAALVNKTYGDSDFSVSATASSGLPVSFSATGNCTMSGSTVHLSGAGSCTITASQAGDANYNAAPDVPQSFTVAKRDQTITFGALADKTFGDADFNVSANTTSGLAVSFVASGNCTISGYFVHLTGAGSCTITASQPGDANFNAAPNVLQAFNIVKANSNAMVTSSVNPSAVGQNVTLTATVMAIANGSALAVTSTPKSATGTVQFKDNGVNLGALVALDGSSVASLTTSSLTAGTHAITAEYSGDQNFNSCTGALSEGQVVQSVVRFSASSYNTTESSGLVMITVERVGDTSHAVTVDYATTDDSSAFTVLPCSTANGVASPRCDFTTAVGTLRFAAGETTKTIPVLISRDSFTEGPETLELTLSSLTGSATVLGTPATTTVTISDVPMDPNTNPIDEAQNFVRQHYHDFLNREPDAAGLNFWTNNITSCGGDQLCLNAARVNTSAAFFLSIEFQHSGYFVYRMYKAGYGDINPPIVPVPLRFRNFIRDTAEVDQGVVVGEPGWQTVLENNKQAFSDDFVERWDFYLNFPTTMTPAQFVDKLNQNAGHVLSPSERANVIGLFGGAPDISDASVCARALRQVAENSLLQQNELNRAFVLMQYFGYLRRNPDAALEPNLNFAGYNFWVDKLNLFNGNYVNAEMVKAFITSTEYRQRFGAQ